MQKPNLVFMVGEDSFSLSQELDRWKKAFLAKHGDMNYEVIDGGSAKLEQIKYSIASAPFLGEKRLVVLNNFLKEKDADTKKELIPILDALPDTTVLIIAEANEPDKRSSLYKFLVKEATRREFNLPKGALLSRWVQRQAEHQGSPMDGAAADYLVSIVGPNLWQLYNEVHKLSLYAKGAPLTRAMVDELVTGSIEQNIFTLTDQLAKGNTAAALKSIRQLQEQGQEAPFLFAMISRQFRIMLEMKALAEQRVPENVIASKMKVHPYVVKSTLAQCRNFTYPQLKRSLQRLLEVDRRLKTGRLHLRQREEDQYLLAIERALLD